jgi:hypothetical protein
MKALVRLAPAFAPYKFFLKCALTARAENADLPAADRTFSGRSFFSTNPPA